MVNPALTKALLEVRDGTRLKVLMDRHHLDGDMLARRFSQQLEEPLLRERQLSGRPRSEKEYSTFVKK